MLELKNIRKEYVLGGESSLVLKNINIKFKSSEFVSILGASGSGKTTMLNIIGGLDKYTAGDLVIQGKSTKDFSDKDWDAYRNSSVGFVFQAYNLIGHLSVLENVKLALSISGISHKLATERTKKALEEVGLLEHIYKKPNQLSGGQMQRVAIARALVTNPKIILADEPTGALDSKTSIQIMELIKKISQEKLVIMVTHNSELATRYSDRIIKVSDGEIIGDTKISEKKNLEQDIYVANKTAMSFKEAIKSSFNNLLTKKVRTILTTVAGSIGIISISLVLSISAGMNNYIKKIENENLSTMPLTISANQSNLRMVNRMQEQITDNSNNIKASDNKEIHKNLYTEDALGNGQNFINYIEEQAKSYYKQIEYSTLYSLKTIVKNYKDEYQEVKIEGARTFYGETIYSKLSSDKNVLLNQYNIVAKLDNNFEYAYKADELILFIGKDNSIDKSVLRALGYDENTQLNFKDLLGKEIIVVNNDTYYKENENYFLPNSINEEMYSAGIKTKIVAIVKPKDDTYTNENFSIAYTPALEEFLLNKEKTSKIVISQKEDITKNILTKESINQDEAHQILGTLGGDDRPTSISIYPKSFEDRDKILEVIASYNKLLANKFGENTKEYEKYSITYVDMAKTMTQMMSQMIATITIILTAFAAISLVVSSVMIGILTYVSVVERTKEIGILRAIGARKKDITRIFNAEAGIIGITSGFTGVLTAIGLSYPISSMIAKTIQVEGFKANLSLTNAIYLILLSLLLTLIASIIPARLAAKKNPVEALRTE